VRATLQQHEAVLLAHALVARLAERAGARVLFIKGPTAVALGVRPDRPSTDVDVLVDPPAFAPLCTALESAGWVLRTPTGNLRHAGDLVFDHSAHYIHPEWPCDLDVHYNFPGFLAPPQQVFEALWQRRTTVEVAGQEIPTPDAVGQALVVGLHALRDPKTPNSRADLAHLARRVPLADDDAVSLSRLARDTGSTGSAATLLASLGVRALPLTAPEERRLSDWQLRQSGLGRSTAWLAEVQQAPMRSKPATVGRALFPPREYLVSSHLADDLTRAQLARLHATRWGRGAAALPRAALVLVRRRRLVRRSAPR